MYPYDNIIWQPTHLHQKHHDFEILLSRQFAGEMLEVILTQETNRQINDMGENIAKRFQYLTSSPYRFHENSAFVRQINLDGGRGTWLALEEQYGRVPDLTKKEPLRYTTHNMDSSFDTLGLLCLFEQWIYYSSILKDI